MKKFTLIITIILSALSVDAQTKLDSNKIVNDKVKLIENRDPNNIETGYNQNVRDIYERVIQELMSELDTLKEQLSSIELKNNRITKESEQKIISLLEKLKEVDSSISTLSEKNDNLDKAYKKLVADLRSVVTTLEGREIEVDSINDSISKKQLYWIIIIVVIILFLALVDLILERKRVSDKEELLKIHADIFEKQIEDSQKLSEWFEKQSETRLAPQGELSAEIDHSFAKRVADEIVKNNANLSRMDESIKGHKQLKRSMQKLEKTLNANGYELIDMLDRPYNEGMNVIATFVPDDALQDGEAIISRIIKPHITYKGKMIQAAEVQVSQG
jgi:hypothetical protein